MNYVIDSKLNVDSSYCRTNSILLSISSSQKITTGLLESNHGTRIISAETEE